MAIEISRLQALLIDMDGTIVDSLPALFKAYLSFLHFYGHQGSHEEFLNLMGPSLDEIVVVLKERYRLPESSKNLLKTYQRGMLDLYKNHLEPFPFVLETLTYAKEKGLLIGLVSSAEKGIVEACLQKLSISSFFDAVVFKQHPLRTKPSPDLYLKALDLLNVSAEHALAIEDAESGIAAANAAGVFALWLTHDRAHKTIDLTQCLCVGRWQQILSILKSGRLLEPM